MKPLPTHVAMGLLLILLAAVTIIPRLKGTVLFSEPSPPTVGPGHDFCVGIEHPETGLGIICAAGPAQIIAEGVRLLRVPEECLEVDLPKTLQPGHRIVLTNSSQGCSYACTEQLPGALTLLCGQGLDINQAQVEDLMVLPGIGETKARLIVESRRNSGPFAVPEDLTRVRGIGTKTVTRLQPWLRW